jgi:hypothetical protein
LGANARPQKGQARNSEPNGQRYLVHAIAGGKARREKLSSAGDSFHATAGGKARQRGASHGEAAEQIALERWDRELRSRLGTDAYGHALGLMDGRIMEAATAAEMKRRGSGADQAIADLRMAGLGIAAAAGARTG